MLIKRLGPPFRYEADGKPVTDPVILEYIKSLVIPPAYKDVEIRYNKDPRADKLAYIGYDSKGRPQHIYAKWWVEHAKFVKFCKMIQFGAKLPAIQSDMKRLASQKKITKNKIIALVMRIIVLCNFRIGNEKYAQRYKSYGISTIEVHHVKFKGRSAVFNFIGKKGVLNECTVVEPGVVAAIKELTAGKKPSDKVFTYDGGILIKPTEVNNWLKSYDPSFTSKMFRIFTVNTLLIGRMREVEPKKMTAAARKKYVVSILKEISCVVHNTPAICKKDYSDVEIINMFIDHPKKWEAAFRGGSPRIAFINFLKKKC